MYRIGIVTVVDVKSRAARVSFEDVGIVSGWLPVVNHSSYVTLAAATDGAEWVITHAAATADRGIVPPADTAYSYGKSHPDVISGGSPDGASPSHEITVRVYGWLPYVGQAVVCLYNDDFNGGGIIIGGLT